jgi:phosphoribosylaminoimidazolecarboxamide formyltransferase / IMP cyclohydrolase
VKPEAYDAVLAELQAAAGALSIETREALAADAFAYTARYDTAIARWFAERSEDFPPLFVRAYEKVTDLSYGENPHQRAAYYQQVGARMHLLSMVRQHQGKQLSYNNLLDLDAARRLVRDFEVPACVIIKHANPCGVAVGRTVQEAYERAFACDPVSAFGGIIAVNRRVDRATARAMAEQFLEVLIAPDYEREALELLADKPNTRVLQDDERRVPLVGDPAVRQVIGGLLVQDRDLRSEDRSEMQVVSARQPTEAEWSEMLFAWRVCKHVSSNAIVLAKDLASVGIGAGQMSRVDSVRLAIDKAAATDTDLAGGALASDAFFPVSDGPQLAVDAGVTAIIQPGGSIRDEMAIEVADRHHMAMVFTGRRHFRH